jgi:hypothetical protein
MNADKKAKESTEIFKFLEIGDRSCIIQICKVLIHSNYLLKGVSAGLMLTSINEFNQYDGFPIVRRVP